MAKRRVFLYSPGKIQLIVKRIINYQYEHFLMTQLRVPQVTALLRLSAEGLAV